MKKVIMSIIAVLMFTACAAIVPVRAEVSASASVNSFAWTEGNLSLGIVSADTLAGYDIFKHVSNDKGEAINARVGGSVTVVKYGRLSLFAGALAPSNEPQAVAVVAGPSVDFDEFAKFAVSSLLQVLPVKLSADTVDRISTATTLKLHYGHDFRYDGDICGVAFGVKLF